MTGSHTRRAKPIKRRPAAPRRWRWTVEEYERLADAGFFRDRRVELIEGEVIEMPAMKTPHFSSIELTNRELEAAFGPSYWVRVQGPLRLGRSMPEPHLAVVPGGPRDYSQHPATALLIVEVSDTSLRYDRGRKAKMYARAGIADYWIVNLIDRVVEVRRTPTADPAVRGGWRYGDVQTFGPADVVSLLALPNASLRVADLLP